MAREIGPETPAGTVVVGLDGSSSSRSALLWAVDQAVAENRPLTLVHAAPGASQHDGPMILEHARAEVSRRAPGLTVHELTGSAGPREVLTGLADRAALVVVGSRGRGPVRSLLLGSVGVALTRHARCPVVVVRPGSRGAVRNGVLVGVDGSVRSQAALELAFRQASLHRLPLTVMHTFVDVVVDGTSVGSPVPIPVDVRTADLEEERLILAESLAGMGEKYPDVPVRAELARGLAAECLLHEASRMNLVVVGSHDGGTASEVLLGSVAATVVEHATCPVVVVPADGRA